MFKCSRQHSSSFLAHPWVPAEVSIENKDIGFVVSNQRVRVKLAAYPFQKNGMVEGVVKTVSADSSNMKSERATTQPTDEQQTLAFKL